MSTEQLEEASLLFNSLAIASTEHNSVPIASVLTAFNNHLRGCICMPAGGASAGGSQQTGFEMELITAQAASRMCQRWPNRESSSGGRKLSWELRCVQAPLPVSSGCRQCREGGSRSLCVGCAGTIYATSSTVQGALCRTAQGKNAKKPLGSPALERW
jgi:hypothetical protein